jgi:hypothetical protein
MAFELGTLPSLTCLLIILNRLHPAAMARLASPVCTLALLLLLMAAAAPAAADGSALGITLLKTDGKKDAEGCGSLGEPCCRNQAACSDANLACLSAGPSAQAPVCTACGGETQPACAGACGEAVGGIGSDQRAKGEAQLRSPGWVAGWWARVSARPRHCARSCRQLPEAASCGLSSQRLHEASSQRTSVRGSGSTALAAAAAAG